MPSPKDAGEEKPSEGVSPLTCQNKSHPLDAFFISYLCRFNFTVKKLHLLGLSALSGILLSISWPSIGDFPFVLFVALVPMLFLENEIARSGKRLFWYSYLGFVIWNFATSWWIYCVSEPLATKFFTAGMAILCNALFMNCIFWLFHKTKKHVGAKQGYTGLVIYWISWEWFHMQWDLSWPWFTLGNGFANEVKWIQWYEYTGVFGGSLWVLLSNILLFYLLKNYQRLKKKKKVFVWLVAAHIDLILFPIFFSWWAYGTYEEKVNPINVVVVQPNIDPYNAKFNYKESGNQLLEMLNLAEGTITDSTDYVVFPETAIARSLWEDKIEKSMPYGVMKDFIDKHPKIKIVIGISSIKFYDEESESTETSRYNEKGNYWYDHFNTAMQVDNSDNTQLYHKSKLVIGVERMPYPALFGFLEKFAIDLGGTTGSLGTQKERAVFKAENSLAKIAPVICYESIYGEFVNEYIHKGANVIFIITNDGWWDDSPGYHQHMAYARLRAIESRRSIARSANTGISCFINQRGDVFLPTEWWVPAAISQNINLNDEVTFYTANGDYIARISGFVSILLILLTIVRKKSKKELLT